MIFLLVEIPSISNPVRWSKLSEDIASLRADERYEMLRILQEISERVRPHAAEIA